MKNPSKLFLIISLLTVLILPGTAFSGSVEDQIAELKAQMKAMQEHMQGLEKQLGEAEAKAAAAQQQSTQVTTEMAEVSNKYRLFEDVANKFSHLKLNGYVRSRWWDGQNENTSFDVTEIAFQLRYDVSENISGEFHIWWHPSGNHSPGRGSFGRYSNWAGPTTFFESAFAEFRNVNIGPIKGKIIAGKARNFAYGICPTGSSRGRVTSDYGLFHESNGQSRITGIQYLTTYKKFKANFALFNGWALTGGARYGARPGGVTYLRTAQLNLDDDNNKAFSTRWAYEFSKCLEIGATFFRAKLPAEDIDIFNNIMGRNTLGTATNDDEHMRMGIDLAYDKGPFSLKAEYFQGEIADVDCNWWYAMAGYKVKSLKSDFYLRYAQANYDQTRVANLANSAAWDKDQVTALWIYHLHPRAKLYFEYYWNMEDNPNGTHHADNDYGFVELILFY